MQISPLDVKSILKKLVISLNIRNNSDIKCRLIVIFQMMDVKAIEEHQIFMHIKNMTLNSNTTVSIYWQTVNFCKGFCLLLDERRVFLVDGFTQIIIIDLRRLIYKYTLYTLLNIYVFVITDTSVLWHTEQKCYYWLTLNALNDCCSRW